jgi:SWI/SNF-related matrix-associated actin-dependent regulator 1 of chromatin subfamily A
LISYLRKYKDATDEKIQKSMRGEVMVRIGILRDIAARGKLKAAVDFLADLLENDQKVVIFCNLHDIVDRLLKVFPKAVCITGRQTMQEKQASIDKFVRDKNTMIAIASIKAASAGVDGLQKSCSNVLFIEEPWTAADRDQAESRVHRNGLKDGATMYHMHGKNTIDEKMWQIIEEKSKISHAVMGGEDNVQTDIVDMMANLFNSEM